MTYLKNEPRRFPFPIVTFIVAGLLACCFVANSFFLVRGRDFEFLGWLRAGGWGC